ncbi:MAG: aldolase/citrate lyase family protein [Bryobacteraceae bacterium]
MTPSDDLFELLEQHGVLLGCAVDSASAATAELAGMLGCDLVWADLEHCSVDFQQAENFCRGAKAGGSLPLLRVAGAERTQILHALEAGARLIVVPMVDSPELALEVVRHGKYAPLGIRGFNGSSRGLGYGIGNSVEKMRWCNEQTHLFVQIETVEAVRRCAEIVGVEGITGGLVGPGDLSVSMGRPLAFNDPEFLALFRKAVRTIREQGKVAATVSARPALTQAALEEGVQILICTTDTVCVRTHLGQVLREVRDQVRMLSSPRATVTS